MDPVAAVAIDHGAKRMAQVHDDVLMLVVEYCGHDKYSIPDFIPAAELSGFPVLSKLVG